MRKALFGSLLVLMFFFLVAAGRLFLFAVTPAGPEGENLIFEVQKRVTSREVSRELEAQKIISQSEAFYWLGRVLGKWTSLKAGDYQISSAQSPLQIIEILTSGKSYGWPLTVHEGDNQYEIADALDKIRAGLGREFLEIAKNAPPSVHRIDETVAGLEGYLFPDTYSVTRSMSAVEVAELMLKHFGDVWKPEWNDRARALGMTRHEVVILGSMIEKETGAAFERPMISSVFHNRLAKRMRLQSDPTTIYGIWEKYSGNLHRSDLLQATPYNTYSVPALPLGPISNPGREALMAALYPEESQYLYFVSHNDGTHEFSATLEAHNAAVKKFQMNQKAREGKSWRDLSQKKSEAAAPSTSP